MLPQLKVAICDLLLINPVELDMLLQHEQQFLSPVPLQALGDVLRGGLHPRLNLGCQFPGITLPFQNGSEDLHAADTTEVAEHITELHVHLCQNFLHALNRSARLGHQITPVALQSARHSDLVGGLKTLIQQAESM